MVLLQLKKNLCEKKEIFFLVPGFYLVALYDISC